MDCGTSFAKYTLFIFNTLVSIIGILGIVFGVLILNKIGTIEVDGQYGFPPQAALPILLIFFGSIVVFISFLGCCGAIRESICMTMTYAFFMLVLLIIQLVIVVLLFVHKEKVQEVMGAVIDQAWERDARDTDIFDAIQRTLKCCGKTSGVDYALIGKLPPSSCCKFDNCVNISNFYGGCRAKFQEVISGDTETAKYAGLGLIVVELVGFIFACCLANNIRNYKRRNTY